MASIKSLLVPPSDSYEFHSDEQPIGHDASLDPNHPESLTLQNENYPPFLNVNIKSFERINKRTHIGFGVRSLPPKISHLKADLFHIKRNDAPDLTKKKQQSLEKLKSYPFPYKFSGDQKMKGFVVDKRFRPRKWISDALNIPLVSGKSLKLPCYTATPPVKRRFSHERPYRAIPDLERPYFVSTITKPTVRPSLTIPIVNYAHSRTLMREQATSIAPVKSSKERMSCLVPNCNKDFADRSSLNRHKKRMHPELANSRSKLSQS